MSNQKNVKKIYHYSVLSLCLCSSLFISTTLVYAQVFVPADITSKSSFNLTLVTALAQKAIIHRDEGFYEVKSSAQPYFEAGADYQHAFAKTYSYILGLHLTATGRNATFQVPVEKINPIYQEPWPLSKFSDFDIGLVVPLLVQREWKLSSRKLFYTQAGIQFHYSFETDIGYGESYADTTGNYIDVFDLNLNTNNQNKPWFTYSLGSGYQWMLKNNNLLKIGLVANFSFTHFINGTYQINIPDDPITQGTYHVTGSYLGIAASYGFTGLNRKLVHKYEE